MARIARVSPRALWNLSLIQKIYSAINSVLPASTRLDYNLNIMGHDLVKSFLAFLLAPFFFFLNFLLFLKASAIQQKKHETEVFWFILDTCFKDCAPFFL